MTPSIAIVMPAHNEGHTIGAVIQAVAESIPSVDILVVDDASSDNTAKIATKHGAQVIPMITNRGAWLATQTGLRFAYQQGYQYVITMDADGQHTAQSLISLINAKSEADVVIGSCTSRGSTARHIAWRLFRLISKLKIQDLTSGLRLYNRHALSVLITREATLLHYQDIGVLMLLSVMPLRLIEVEVPMLERQNGRSRIFKSWFAVAHYMAQTLLLSASKAGRNKNLVNRLKHQGVNIE